jgi:crotonobetainyl-CoA:carnitine CoA-transferase CaiB-like acyl-CoA transferase
MGLERTYVGVRVLDLSENIAGPLATMILADLGADVVKIERRGTGDSTRDLPPRWSGESTVFLTVNRNKRSVALDLKTGAGRQAVLDLASTADVVVESFGPGAAERLGLGAEDIRARNGRVLHCSISAFGRGPLGEHRPGYDALIQAFTGIMAMTGEPDGQPCRAAPSIVDITTGMWAALSIMAGLARRGDSGPGEQLEAALVDSGFFLLGHQIMGHLATGQFPGRLGSAAPSAAPNQAFRTQDRPVMIATSTDRLFQRLCACLGRPELAADPRFLTPASRIDHRDALSAMLERTLTTAPAAHWLNLIGTAGIPIGPVQDLGSALAHPITAERAVVEPAEPGRIEGLQQLRLPIDTDRRAAARQPPALGEHTEEVLRQAGYDDASVGRVMGTADELFTVEVRTP